MSKQITRKQAVWLIEYLQCWNATEAARRAGYKCPRISGPENLHRPALAEAIEARIAERMVAADEALARLGEQARADIGVFFKAVERWLEDPLPSMEVLDQRVDVDDEGNRHVVYLVRQVVLDIDKLLDPQFSHVVRKFTDSPKGGLSIEIYDVQKALKRICKLLGLFAKRGQPQFTPDFDLDEWQRKQEERHRALGEG